MSNRANQCFLVVSIHTLLSAALHMASCLRKIRCSFRLSLRSSQRRFVLNSTPVIVMNFFVNNPPALRFFILSTVKTRSKLKKRKLTGSCIFVHYSSTISWWLYQPGWPPNDSCTYFYSSELSNCWKTETDVFCSAECIRSRFWFFRRLQVFRVWLYGRYYRQGKKDNHEKKSL